MTTAPERPGRNRGSQTRIRLKDVAERAGVSVKTVSNVVNGYTHVSPRMREHVQRAIDALGYRPNMTARGLRGGRSGVIALAVPELDVPYFAELSRLVVSAAEERGWTVLIDQTGGTVPREQIVVAGIRDHLVDGVIFSPLALAGADLSGGDGRTPMVLLGERIHHGPADHVMIDNVAAARDATLHLVGQGRRRIAAIGTQRVAAGATARQRLSGYHKALTEAGLPVQPELIAPARAYHRADGAAAMLSMLDDPTPPDAVFCFNDPLALGALRALHTRGVRVPDDVAVIGFDDIEDGRYSIPTLSTIAPDKQQIARVAVELLARRIDGDRDAEPQEIRADYELVVRESTRRD